MEAQGPSCGGKGEDPIAGAAVETYQDDSAGDESDKTIEVKDHPDAADNPSVLAEPNPVSAGNEGDPAFGHPLEGLELSQAWETPNRDIRKCQVEGTLIMIHTGSTKISDTHVSLSDPRGAIVDSNTPVYSYGGQVYTILTDPGRQRFFVMLCNNVFCSKCSEEPVDTTLPSPTLNMPYLHAAEVKDCHGTLYLRHYSKPFDYKPPQTETIVKSVHFEGWGMKNGNLDVSVSVRVCNYEECQECRGHAIPDSLKDVSERKQSLQPTCDDTQQGKAKSKLKTGSKMTVPEYTMEDARAGPKAVKAKRPSRDELGYTSTAGVIGRKGSASRKRRTDDDEKDEDYEEKPRKKSRR